MKTKQIILSLLLSIVGLSARADDAKIIVWLNDGGKTEILFNQMPEFTYQDGNVSIQNGNTTLSWPLANLKKFTFEDIEHPVTTGVKDVSVPMHDITNGCAVYDLSGRIVKQKIYSLSELPKGTYILKDGTVTTKVVKR